MKRDAPGQSVAGHAGVPQVEQPVLVWDKADGSKIEYPLGQTQPVVLGRDAENEIVLESKFVSKKHATVRYEGGQYVIEDLGSANGTRLNGAPVSISILTPGDSMEVGDQALRFIDRAEGRKKKASAAARGAAPLPPSNIGKLLRLATVALLFGGGLLFLLRFLVLGGGGGSAPPSLDDVALRNASGRWTLANQQPAPYSTNAAIVSRILAQAKTAGVDPNDALFDEARAQYASGRLLDAARLFSAVIERDPKREVAKMRLDEVKGELEGEIARHRAEAERMTSQLRFADAAGEWERVILLLEPADARVAAAKAGLEASRSRASTP